MSKECSICHKKISLLDTNLYLDNNKDYAICQICNDMVLDCRTLIKKSPQEYLKKRNDLLVRSENALPKAKDKLLETLKLWEEEYLHIDYTVKDGKITNNNAQYDGTKYEGNDNAPITRSDFEQLMTELSLIKDYTMTIKNCFVFFTVLAVLGLIFYLLMGLAN